MQYTKVKHRHARRARVIFYEVSEIGTFMELFTIMIWLILQAFLVAIAMYSKVREKLGIYDIHDNKQLLDEVFVISRIIKVEVRVISRSRRLRLITLTETLIILDITKTESNNCFIIH